MEIVNEIKNVVNVVVNFFTGLGFYGVGLLASGVGVWALLGWPHIGAGLIGAFIFKNFKAIVDYVKGVKL